MSIRVAIAQINPKLGDLQANLSLYEEKVCQGMKKQVDDRGSKIEKTILYPRYSIFDVRISAV